MSTNLDQAASLRQKLKSMKGLKPKQSISCIAIASGKGGVGKTFITVNLAVALRQLGKKVLIVDADLGLANADILLGVNPEFTLQDAIFSGKTLHSVVTQTEFGVDLLAASSGAREMVSMGDMRTVMVIQELMKFAANYDFLLFDCASGIDSKVTSFLEAAPLNLIIANPTPTSIMDVYALIKVIYQENLCDSPNLIVNMAESDTQGKKVHETLTKVAESNLSSELNLLGIVPSSKGVQKALTQRKPVVDVNPDDPAAKRIREIAKQLVQKGIANTNLGNLDMTGLVKGLLNSEERVDGNIRK